MSNNTNAKPKLWHCYNSRSLRPLWAMEEIGMTYELEVMPFPPRFFKKDFLASNILGTVPYFEHGATCMTESTGICHYLVERFQGQDIAIKPDHAAYGNYLNWLYHSDATLTFPQTIVMRYTHLEPEERKLSQAVKDYGQWYIARLRLLDQHLIDHKFLCDERFTIADIAITYALYLGELLGLSEYYTPQVTQYLERMKSRDGFQRAIAIGKEHDPFKGLSPIKFNLFDKG